jgi:hypothetical protein
VLVLLALLVAHAEAAAQGDFEIAPRGYVQFDWRAYPDWNISTGTGRLNLDTLEIRRARVGVDGQWRGLSFEVTVDPEDEDGVLVKDAYAAMRFSDAFRVRAGQFKLPGGREYGRSARTIDYLERAALADSASAGRDVGAALFGDVGDRLTYEAGVFAGDGNGRASRSGTAAAGRVEFAVTGDIELGGSFSMARTDAVDSEDPNGPVGRAPSSFRFFEQVYTHGWRVRSGADVRWERGPWRVDGELLRLDEQRREQGLDFEDLPRLVGLGWSASITHQLFRRQGDRVRWREIELAGRVDVLGFDDSGRATDMDSVRARATDIRPRSVLTTTLGASWSPSTWTRVMTNASWEHYDETRSGPRAGRPGFLVIGTRLQVSLP